MALVVPSLSVTGAEVMCMFALPTSSPWRMPRVSCWCQIGLCRGVRQVGVAARMISSVVDVSGLGAGNLDIGSFSRSRSRNPWSSGFFMKGVARFLIGRSAPGILNMPGAQDRSACVGFCLPGRTQAVEQLTDLLDGRIERIDLAELRGLDAVEIVDMAQGQQVLQRVEFPIQSPCQWRCEGEVLDQTLGALESCLSAEQTGGTGQCGAVGNDESRAGRGAGYILGHSRWSFSSGPAPCGPASERRRDAHVRCVEDEIGQFAKRRREKLCLSAPQVGGSSQSRTALSRRSLTLVVNVR